MKRITTLAFAFFYILVIRAQFITENVSYIYGEPLKQYAVVVKTIDVGTSAGDINGNRKIVDKSAYMMGKKFKVASTVVKSNDENVYRILLATSDDINYVSAAQSKISVKIAQTYILKIGSNKPNEKVMASQISNVVESKKPEIKELSSDVDVNLPSNATNNENTFAIIFANENYQEEAKVDYAQNDGKMFKEYCHKVLGLPEDNIHIRNDATLNNIKAEVSWMQQVAKAYNGQARFIVFYAGHGIPDEKSAAAYLLPVDGKGTMLDTGYSLAKLYETLGNMPAERVTVFMDACFSGSKRGEGMLASARGVAIKAKTQSPQGKMVVFSAAQGDETAYPYKEKEHGLFTYYLLKKLKETKGNVTYGELSTYLETEVKRKSIVANSKSQTPTVNASQSFANSWKNMKLK